MSRGGENGSANDAFGRQCGPVAIGGQRRAVCALLSQRKYRSHVGQSHIKSSKNGQHRTAVGEGKLDPPRGVDQLCGQIHQFLHVHADASALGTVPGGASGLSQGPDIELGFLDRPACSQMSKILFCDVNGPFRLAARLRVDACWRVPHARQVPEEAMAVS
jgi:hypothetical protein